MALQLILCRRGNEHQDWRRPHGSHGNRLNAFGGRWEGRTPRRTRERTRPGPESTARFVPRTGGASESASLRHIMLGCMCLGLSERISPSSWQTLRRGQGPGGALVSLIERRLMNCLSTFDDCLRPTAAALMSPTFMAQGGGTRVRGSSGRTHIN